jgi:hypothetical protein
MNAVTQISQTTVSTSAAPAQQWVDRDHDDWRELEAPEPMQVTLLELVKAVSEVSDNETEVIGTVSFMLASGSVELRGSFRNETLGSALA